MPYPSRTRRDLLAGSLALAGTFPRVAAAQSGRGAPMRAADFLDTFGVNLHLQTSDAYADAGRVLEAMRFCGLVHARDRCLRASGPVGARYAALAAGGVRFCLFVGSNPPFAVDQMDALERRAPGTVAAVEGPNEIGPAFAFAGATGTLAGERLMSGLRAAMSRTPALSSRPLVAFTGYQKVAVDCDIANLHPYPRTGAQPEAAIRLALDRWVGPGGVMPGKPLMFTEFGYHTLVGRPTRPNAWQGVDEPRQASLLLNGWLGGAASGIARIYAYELFDGREPPGRSDMQNHFGLFRADGTPKPVAVALRRLTRRLADPAPAARTFVPGSSPFAVSAGEDVRSLALAGSTGAYSLLLWSTRPVWDPQSASRLPETPSTVMVTLDRPRRAQVWDFVRDDQSTEERVTRKLRISLASRPLLVTI